MSIEIISRNCIKPSTPTPLYLKTFRLSLLDQLSPNIHGNSTFFYPYNATTHGTDPISEFSTKSQLLRRSLSETLTRFYPLAGRLQDASTIDCNDDGAFFIEARTDSPLSDILTSPDFNTIQHLLPTYDKETMEISNGSMLLVQFTLFGCGGTTVTISITHKIADIAAFIAFIQSWTAACRGAQVAVPELDIGGSLFPQREIPGMSASVRIAAEKFKARRFIFSESKVGELRSRVISALGKEAEFKPSRVEVVLALIWRCAVSTSISKTGSFKPSALFQAVNLRTRMDPPVPDSALGNFVWPFAVMAQEEGDLELQELVKKMRKSMKEFLEKKVNKWKGEGAFGGVMEALKERGELFKRNKDMLVYKCSSWCKFPLLEFDFGWGNNVWMTSVNNLVSNTIALMDSQDGGVEVLVTLDEQEMDIFQQNQDLLHYALLNPSIVIV